MVICPPSTGRTCSLMVSPAAKLEDKKEQHDERGKGPHGEAIGEEVTGVTRMIGVTVVAEAIRQTEATQVPEVVAVIGLQESTGVTEMIVTRVILPLLPAMASVTHVLLYPSPHSTT